MTTDLTDEQLLREFAATGDLGYFDTLAGRYIGKIRAMIYPMVLNHYETDDLTQETLLRTVKSLSKFNGRSRFSTWIYRIAMNTTFSHIRKRNQHITACYADPEECLGSDADQPGCNALQYKEMDQAITRALAGLTPALRAAITLTAIHGMSPREAASVIGCLPATLYRRVHDARRILKTQLSDYLE